MNVIKNRIQFENLTKSKSCVKFSASWCTPCKRIVPDCERLAKVYETKYKFATVDVDELPSVVEKLRIDVVPTFIFFQDNKEIDRLTGSDLNEFEKKLENNI